jgi:hypothetical protein
MRPPFSSMITINVHPQVNVLTSRFGSMMIWLIAYQFSTRLTATQQDYACKLSTVDKQEPLLNNLIRC